MFAGGNVSCRCSIKRELLNEFSATFIESGVIYAENALMELNDERCLIERAQKDPTAFGVLFERHYQPIFGYVFRRVTDWNAAKDITADVFLKSFKNLWRYRWQGISFSSWLYRIATNEVRMYYRQGRRSAISLDQLMEEIGFEPIDPQKLDAEKSETERQLRMHEDFVAIRAKMLALSVNYQDVLALRFFEHKSVKEIAEILDKREGTIKSLLSRGISKLKKHF
jgi:RNA polymerase sigma-70 factor, ECF subfamily